MKKITLIFLTFIAISAQAGFDELCYIQLIENDTIIGQVFLNHSSLKRCMRKANKVLKKDSSLKNPVVRVSHPDLEKPVFIRL